jgi:plastocyanin
MVDFSFSPGEITVAAGGSVNFVNNGVAPHTATARDGSFDSGVVAPGSKYRGHVCAIRGPSPSSAPSTPR